VKHRRVISVVERGGGFFFFFLTRNVAEVVYVYLLEESEGDHYVRARRGK
jgi:hypothetical protein